MDDLERSRCRAYNPACCQRSPGILAARVLAGKHLLAVAQLHGFVVLLHRRDLRGGEARVGVSAFALQHGDIERARAGVVQQVVLHAVPRVARVEDRAIDEREFGNGDDARWIQQPGKRPRDSRRLQVGVEVGRRARDDGVEVFGIPLRGHEALTSTCRAAVPVRQARRALKVRRNDRLGLGGQLVHGAVAEIDQLLRMTDGKKRVRALMARIGRGGGIAFPQGQRHRNVVQAPGPSAVADRLKLSVPVRGRQPHLDLDVRVRGRPRHRRDTTVRRQGDGLGRRHVGRESRVGHWSRRRERSGRDPLCGRDGRVGKRQRREGRAARVVDRDRCNQERQNHRQPPARRVFAFPRAQFMVGGALPTPALSQAAERRGLHDTERASPAPYRRVLGRRLPTQSKQRAEPRRTLGRGNLDKPQTAPRLFSPQARDGEQQLKIRSGGTIHGRLLRRSPSVRRNWRRQGARLAAPATARDWGSRRSWRAIRASARATMGRGVGRSTGTRTCRAAV